MVVKFDCWERLKNGEMIKQPEKQGSEMDKFLKINNRGKYFFIFALGLFLCLTTLWIQPRLFLGLPPKSPSATSTLPPTFYAIVAQPSYCHNGPNESYLGAIPVSADAEVDVLAMNSDGGDWLLIRGDNIDPCWIKASAVTLPPNIDLKRILILTTVITVDDAPCRIYLDDESTIQTVIPKNWRVVVYGKSDIDANWVLVGPHDSTEQCWVAKNKLSSFESNTLPIELVNTPLATSTFIPAATATPSLSALSIVATEAKQQFDNAFESNIAFNPPKTMKLGNTIVLELLLSPFVSETQLVATLVVNPELTLISPGEFINPQGDIVVVESAPKIKSTNLMKAELKSQNPGAFIIERMHSDDIQASANAKWQWSITAKEKGVNYLTLNIYMLYKVDDKETWTQVKSFDKSIEVTVNPIDQISSFDWKWIVGILIPALFIPLFFRWYDKKKQKPVSEKPTTKGKRKPKVEKKVEA